LYHQIRKIIKILGLYFFLIHGFQLSLQSFSRKKILIYWLELLSISFT